MVSGEHQLERGVASGDDDNWPDKAARDTLRFEIPSPVRWARILGSLLNWLFYLKLGGLQYGPIRPIIPHEALDRLRAIPAGSGNLLIGPHPGPLDAHLMFHLFAKTCTGPATFMMASETYYGGTFLRRALFKRLGVVPVARGRSNPDAIRFMTERLAHGWWAGIFPEGDVYYSREVMPMEYGAVRIAVEAALMVEQTRHHQGKGVGPRPILITPFACAYFFSHPTRTIQRLSAALAGVESRPEVFGHTRSGDMATRLRAIGERLLDYKASQYGIPCALWHDTDPFRKAEQLQNAVLSMLEMKYLGSVKEGFARRRALKVRMRIVEMLARDDTPEPARTALRIDAQITRELPLMVPFKRAYVEKYGDLEMWVEYLRRYRTVLGMNPANLGPQEAVFRVAEPLQVDPIAHAYQLKQSELERRTFLFEQTEALREIIQSGVDQIRDGHPVSRLDLAA